MTVVQVREVGVGVSQRLVPVPMGVGLARRVCRTMKVLMMLIVDVAVLVLHVLVRVQVDVLLAQVQV